LKNSISKTPISETLLKRRSLPMSITIKQRLKSIFKSAKPVSPPKQPEQELFTFQCNICGNINENIPIQIVRNREAQSCQQCRSSLRMRSVIYALSMELFGKNIILPDFPEDKSISGIGMSDWEGYAGLLSQKLAYINTYYHQEPKLDITQIESNQEHQYDFIISTDVFEHIPPPISTAFTNVRRLLKPNGVLIFTVPYKKEGVTEEHFPDLFDFRIVTHKEKSFLINVTKEGVEQVFDNLVFHGGEGFTLEMRMFSELSLREELEQAQFDYVKIYNDKVPEFGIIWPISFALPIAARSHSK